LHQAIAQQVASINANIQENNASLLQALTNQISNLTAHPTHSPPQKMQCDSFTPDSDDDDFYLQPNSKCANGSRNPNASQVNLSTNVKDMPKTSATPSWKTKLTT
jgi:hypothetical protein